MTRPCSCASAWRRTPRRRASSYAAAAAFYPDHRRGRNGSLDAHARRRTSKRRRPRSGLGRNANEDGSLSPESQSASRDGSVGRAAAGRGRRRCGRLGTNHHRLRLFCAPRPTGRSVHGVTCMATAPHARRACDRCRSVCSAPEGTRNDSRFPARSRPSAGAPTWHLDSVRAFLYQRASPSPIGSTHHTLWFGAAAWFRGPGLRFGVRRFRRGLLGRGTARHRVRSATSADARRWAGGEPADDPWEAG